jgi:hypothetical protein
VALLAKVQVIKARGASAEAVTIDAPVDLTIAPNGGCIVWKDPGSNGRERAYYYVRVVQEPTWRWSHHDCAVAPSNCGTGVDRTVQERTWTSPIWYEP